MKKITLTLALLLTSLAASAACPDTRLDSLRKKQTAIELESKNLNIVANYLASRLNEKNGEFENDRSVGALMLETRTKALNLTNESARLQIEISKAILACSAR